MKTKQKFNPQEAMFKSYNNEAYKNIGKTSLNPINNRIQKTNELPRSREYVKTDYSNERDRPPSNNSTNPFHHQNLRENLREVSRKPLTKKSFGSPNIISVKADYSVMKLSTITGKNQLGKVEYLQTDPGDKSFLDKSMYMSYDFTQGKAKKDLGFKLDLSGKHIQR